MDLVKDIYILSIETSQRVCSVAIHKNGLQIANSTLFSEKSASGLLTPIIEQSLKNCNLKPADLDAIAVAKGPGSYTGLRIATSTAKGLCLAIDKPLIAINTLEGMAAQIRDFYPENYLFCPMLDARRMEVYYAVFDENLQILQKTGAKVIDETAFAELLSENAVVFFGDGAEKCKAFLAQKPNAFFCEKSIVPNADTIGVLAFEKFTNEKFENLVTFEPFYLKEFVGNVKA